MEGPVYVDAVKVNYEFVCVLCSSLQGGQLLHCKDPFERVTSHFSRIKNNVFTATIDFLPDLFTGNVGQEPSVPIPRSPVEDLFR